MVRLYIYRTVATLIIMLRQFDVLWYVRKDQNHGKKLYNAKQFRNSENLITMCHAVLPGLGTWYLPFGDTAPRPVSRTLDCGRGL